MEDYRKVYIETHIDQLIFAKMRMVRYGHKLFWSFELADHSTKTLTHEEFQYFLEFQIKRTRADYKKR